MKDQDMASETIVAVFETASDAEKAIADLVAAGIPSHAIQHYSGSTAPTADQDLPTTSADEPRRGFWAWLTGEEAADFSHTVYDRSIESGGTVVTVIADDRDGDRIVSILEAHTPVDLEERGAQYGLTGTATGGMSTTAQAAARPATGTEEVIPLAEETLEVGKREVDRGTTRLRRYVVERPVEEQIRLRNETVSIQRRPVSAGASVAADAFTDKTVEVRETAEEAVVGKTARVVEEVLIKKGVEERVETVRDTVRPAFLAAPPAAGSDCAQTAAEHACGCLPCWRWNLVATGMGNSPGPDQFTCAENEARPDRRCLRGSAIWRVRCRFWVG
jgi:uncharacterized protein (TIGR02271 family)